MQDFRGFVPVKLVGICLAALFSVALLVFSPINIFSLTLDIPGYGQSLSDDEPLWLPAQRSTLGPNKIAGPAHAVAAPTQAPIRIIIPTIKVNANLESVGETLQGAAGVPKNVASAAWFNVGPVPGTTGSAVIDGHTGFLNGMPAVFNALPKLNVGDTVSVDFDQGPPATFVVRATQSFDPKADASGVFFSSDGKSHLNLITCEGNWNDSTKSYSKRLVVFTDKQ